MSSWPQEVWAPPAGGCSHVHIPGLSTGSWPWAQTQLRVFSPLLGLKMSQKPHWDQVLQGFGGICSVFYGSYFNFLGVFFPSVVILVKLEVFVIATIDHSWSHLPSPAGLSLSCAHSVALSCLVFLKNVSLLTSGYRRTQNLASSPRTWLWIPN